MTGPADVRQTFFSTGFFDFLPGGERGGRALVSPWLWLYAVLTFGLTAIVMAAWLVASRRQIAAQNKYMAALHEAEGGSGPSSASVGAAEKAPKVTVDAAEPGEEMPESAPELPRRIPTSKVTIKGFEGDVDTCPCCGVPLPAPEETT